MTGWMAWTALACVLWACADACSDLCIPEKRERTSCRITSTQHAVMCGVVSLIVAAALMPWIGSTSTSTVVYATAGGAVHYVAFFMTQQAFAYTSSTVITPLLQLSAVWLLLFSMCGLRSDSHETIRPCDAAAVILIFCGGIMPAARGRMSTMLSVAFWRQPAVKYCLVGEFLVAVYSAGLHSHHGDDTFTLFVFSRLGNALACLSMLVLSGNTRTEAILLMFSRRRKLPVLAMSATGHVFAIAGVYFSMVSYQQISDPAIVNAAEGGVQQLIGLVVAYALTAVSKRARPVEQLRLKCFSAACVTCGLVLSK